MSRSNPNENQPNPSQRWFEWSGADGHFRYYDKEQKKRVSLEPDFTFLVLDTLQSVRGWHEPSQSGILSNEVRSTNTEPLLVRAFKGGKIASGLYSEIREKVAAAGGHFTTTIYCAFKDDGVLKMGAVQLKGAALSAWFEFSKLQRKAIWENAIRVKGSLLGKKGAVTFHVPAFALQPVSGETQKEAVRLDIELQDYLKEYLARNRQNTEHHQPDAPSEYDVPASEPVPEPPPSDDPPPIENDDIPF